MTCRWLRGLFDDSDENGDGELSLREVVNMMKKLNVGVSTKIIRKMFKVSNKRRRERERVSNSTMQSSIHRKLIVMVTLIRN